MTNIELKELYDNEKITLKQIKEQVQDLEHDIIRGEVGNTSMLFVKVNKKNNDDKDIYIAVSGIYYKETLPKYISF